MVKMCTPLLGVARIGEIFEVRNGQEAFDEVKQKEHRYVLGGTRHFDMIMLDLDMPIMNGLEASVNIKRFYQTTNEQLLKNFGQSKKDIDWFYDLLEVFEGY